MMMGLFGCASPKQQDFVGVWVGDNVKLELKSDGSCIATGQNAYLLLDEEATGNAVNYILTGKWEIGGQFKYLPKKWCEHDVISIDLTNEDTRLKFGNILHYKGSIMSKSYTLYFDIGDPDFTMKLMGNFNIMFAPAKIENGVEVEPPQWLVSFIRQSQFYFTKALYRINGNTGEFTKVIDDTKIYDEY